jgi:hypothetical protein
LTPKDPFDNININEILAEYNKFRSPEVTAKLLHIKDGKLILEFEGTFCNTCGFYDYFEDFIYEMKRLNNIELNIDNIKESDFQKFIVIYSISDRPSL